MNKQVKDHFVKTYGQDRTVDILFEVLEAIPISVFIKNQKLEVIFANKANLNLTECTLDEVISRTDFERYPMATAEVFAREDQAVLINGEIRSKEETIETKSGNASYFLTHKNRIMIDNVTPLLVGTNTSINGLKEREAELALAAAGAQQARQELQEIMDAIPLGTTLLNEDLTLNLINKANREFWNLPKDQELAGIPFRDFIEVDPVARAKVPQAEWTAYVERRLEELKTGNTVARDISGMNGETFQFSCQTMSGGKRLLSFFDVTAQKQVNDKLEQMNAKVSSDFSDMRAIMNSMKMGVALLDSNLDILFVNKAFQALWDWDQSSVGLGASFGKLIALNRERGVYSVDDADWDNYLETRISEIAKGDITPREFVRNDGITLEYSCTSLSDGKRLVCYYDVTAQKAAAEVFQDAERKAILADRAKSEFLANMSHEIRTPMNGVLGMAELLARTELDPKQKTFTDIIVKSGNALLTIINDILDFSKIDAGQLALDTAPFKLRESIEDVATLISARAQEKDIELIVRIDPSLPELVVGDVGRIRQIVTNLLGNAVKFTEIGHVLVDVSGTVDPDTNIANLLFAITDTGVGIEADKVKLVFEKFSQVDASSTRRHEGTGLGLAISTKLVALMGGEIGAESEIGKGSTFWFKIELPAHGIIVQKNILPFDVAGSRVLIIDDNSINRSILLEQTRSWNFDACAATGGREGIAVLSQAKSFGLAVDVIILDYHMPELNGADVARIVRQTPELASVPIVLLTSVDTAMQGSEFYGLHINAHLMKPARSSLLFETIVGVIREARSHVYHIEEVEKPKSLAELGAVMNLNTQAPNAIPVAKMIELVEVSQPMANPAPQLPVQLAPENSVQILVAEDNAVNQIVFTQILESMPYSFEIVDNGRKAVEALKDLKPTLILMDVSMPEMNGLEATQAIRKYEAEAGLTRTPIIGVTAHALKGDRDRCIEAGMDDYMSKPISPDMLAAKVETYMQKLSLIKSA